ncbi:hypothetical protein A3L09_01025 [Thermococcus profundus]|uniref:Uncharacterized protein n=1 Tax=Thermococcus profundus TaxID=49899 RepID=A0A2Z2MBE7_THEPR|nr:hypothetical protein [Thermococcus profundus]ASJ01942.1 hypothetical protein A3L09_01025 [Thermococcus profundus]
MGIEAEALKAVSLLMLTAYTVFVFKNRKKFNLKMDHIIPIIVTSAIITMVLYVEARKNIQNGSFLTLGYTGLFFFSLSFGELAGVAAAMGLAMGEYVMNPNPEGVLLLLLLSTLSGILTGWVGRKRDEFSMLLLGSIIGGTALVSGEWAYYHFLKGLTVDGVAETLAPLVASVTTGVLLATALVVGARKMEKWPSPIERRA